MAYTLRSALHTILGKDKSYLHYYNSIVKAYETDYCSYDIKNLVKKIYVDVPCPRQLSKRGFHKRFCYAVIDFKEFKYQFEKYMNEYIYPMQELRKNIIIARKAWIKKYGFIAKGNQYCQKSMYDCSKCINKSVCDISKKYTNNEPALRKATKMIELLYGNIQSGYFASQVSE